MTAKKEKKEMTLRQKMRNQAEEQLILITGAVVAGVIGTLKGMNADVIDSHEIMRLCSATQTATLKAKLVGLLADQAEADLVKLWNDQQGLDLEKKDGE